MSAPACTETDTTPFPVEVPGLGGESSEDRGTGGGSSGGGGGTAAGSFEANCPLSLACDVGGCTTLAEAEEDFGQWQIRLTAREYIRVGEQSATRCALEDEWAGIDAGPGAGGRSVPTIESRAPAGPLAVRLVHYRDRECETGPITIDIPVD